MLLGFDHLPCPLNTAERSIQRFGYPIPPVSLISTEMRKVIALESPKVWHLEKHGFVLQVEGTESGKGKFVLFGNSRSIR